MMFNVERFERMTRKVPVSSRVETYTIDYPAERRKPGGLTLAVLYVVGDGYDTSLMIGEMLNTSIDNVNGALQRLASGHYVSRWGSSPIRWNITQAGREKLRRDLWEGDE